MSSGRGAIARLSFWKATAARPRGEPRKSLRGQVAAVEMAALPAWGSGRSSPGRVLGARGNSFRRFVAIDIEPFFLELDAPILPNRDIRGERDDGIAQCHLRPAARLILGIGIANAPGPMLELFG